MIATLATIHLYVTVDIAILDIRDRASHNATEAAIWRSKTSENKSLFIV